MNFSTMQTHVKRNLGNRSDINDLIKDWINGAYLDIVTTGRLPEIGRFGPIPCPSLDDTTDLSTVASQDTITEPTNLIFPISLRDTTNGRPLLRRGIRWIDRHKSISEGQPRVYARFGGEFVLDPTPDDVYTIQCRFRKKVTADVLSASDDTPVVDPSFHEIIVFGATFRGAAAHQRTDADMWLERAKQHLLAHSEFGTEEEEDANIGVKVVM